MVRSTRSRTVSCARFATATRRRVRSRHLASCAPRSESGNGSGTIFFSWCNLKCQFCQHWETSNEGAGELVTARELAAMMLELQANGCHNINFVTPEHVVPQLLEALPLAIDGGLRLPIVYNTSAYDSLDSLALLDGIVDFLEINPAGEWFWLDDVFGPRALPTAIAQTLLGERC